MKKPFCLPLAVLATISLQAQDYTFTLDGKVHTPAGLRIHGRADQWAEGDVIFVQGFTLTLGKPGAWNFGSRQASAGVLTVHQDAKETPIALIIDSEYTDDGGKRVINPLEGLNAAERAGLRGLSINAPVANLKEMLRDVPAAQLALVLSDRCLADGDTRLPELPSDLPWLGVDESSNLGFNNLDTLSALTSLRGLQLRLMTVETFDAGLLAGMKSLKQLGFNGAALQRPDALGQLKSLRDLDVSFTDSLSSVEWCRELTELERIDLAGTAVEDLSPLAALPALRVISAQNSRVRTLGRGGFSALTRLNLLAAPIKAEEAAAFQKAHPECEVLSGYRDSLVKAVKRATRVRIRSGGTCHRRENEERTLAELKSTEEIAALLELMAFAENEKPFHCMCCGDPSFEFYEGDRLVAMLGFHHGHGMRWAGGPWPGDVHLEGAKAIALCHWLEQRGVIGAGEELRQATRENAALKRRHALYRTLMPDELPTALDTADSAEAAAKLFVEKLPDSHSRARLVLSLYGCSQDSWNIAAGMDEFLAENLLPGITPADMATLADDPALPAAARRGLARWFFEENKWEALDHVTRARHLAAIAMEGLTSPRAHNRQRTMLQLSRIGTPEALTLLRNVLAGEIKPTALSKEDADEPGGAVSYQPDTLDLPDDAPDVAHAAALLMRLKDESAAAAVEKALALMPADLREKVRVAATSAQ